MSKIEKNPSSLPGLHEIKKQITFEMPGKQAQQQPVSRELVRIIRESSRLEGAGHTLTDHMSAIGARQAKAVEFYLRACALRLDQGL